MGQLAPEREQERTADLAGAAVPTEEAPDRGRVARDGQLITHAIRWVSPEGVYVVESSEFPLRGTGNDWNEAFDDLWKSAQDLFDFLADLSAEERATAGEREDCALLGTRLLAVLKAENERLMQEVRKGMTVKGSLLNVLHSSRRQQLTAALRQERWDTDQIVRPNSRTALPA